MRRVGNGLRPKFPINIDYSERKIRKSQLLQKPPLTDSNTVDIN